MTILVTVDEIDGDHASLLLRRGSEEEPLGVFSLADLPAGVKTGDILSLSFSLEEEETKAAKMRVQRLHERLLKKSKE